MEEKGKVAVVMSTYNGEKYIKEQIDSILKQTYKPIDIYIRDDGSSDSTIEILDKYKKSNSNIFVFTGENLGYAKSFYKILEEAEGYDFYAFCDQDDIWYKNKIENAVNKINEYTDIPVCVYTEYDICDEDMNFLAKSNMNKGMVNFRNSLVELPISGNTMVFNSKLRNSFLNINMEYICSHDWLIYMLASGIGKLVYDEKSYLKYRRTGNNTSPTGSGRIRLFIYRIKKFLLGDYLKKLKKQTIEFYNKYNEFLSEKNKNEIKKFISEKKNVGIMLQKLLSLNRYRQSMKDEILLRFMFLLFKI